MEEEEEEAVEEEAVALEEEEEVVVVVVEVEAVLVELVFPLVVVSLVLVPLMVPLLLALTPQGRILRPVLHLTLEEEFRRMEHNQAHLVQVKGLRERRGVYECSRANGCAGVMKW